MVIDIDHEYQIRLSRPESGTVLLDLPDFHHVRCNAQAVSLLLDVVQEPVIDICGNHPCSLFKRHKTKVTAAGSDLHDRLPLNIAHQTKDLLRFLPFGAGRVLKPSYQILNRPAVHMRIRITVMCVSLPVRPMTITALMPAGHRKNQAYQHINSFHENDDFL